MNKMSVKECQESSAGWHISWNEYFMGIAQVVRARSKDPNTKVGACIVGRFGRESLRFYKWRDLITIKTYNKIKSNYK